MLVLTESPCRRTDGPVLSPLPYATHRVPRRQERLQFFWGCVPKGSYGPSAAAPSSKDWFWLSPLSPGDNCLCFFLVAVSGIPKSPQSSFEPRPASLSPISLGPREVEVRCKNGTKLNPFRARPFPFLVPPGGTHAFLGPSASIGIYTASSFVRVQVSFSFLPKDSPYQDFTFHLGPSALPGYRF